MGRLERRIVALELAANPSGLVLLVQGQAVSEIYYQTTKRATECEPISRIVYVHLDREDLDL